MIQEPTTTPVTIMAVIEETTTATARDAGRAADLVPAGAEAGRVPYVRAHNDPVTATSFQIAKANGNGNGSGFMKKEIRDLEELLSKLNPMAEEFVPPSLNFVARSYFDGFYYENGGGITGIYSNGFGLKNGGGGADGGFPRKVFFFFFFGKILRFF